MTYSKFPCGTCDNTCDASKKGHLECLKYAKQHQFPFVPAARSNAAANGHLSCLQFLHENIRPCDGITILHAAKCGHVDCLRFCHEQGCTWPSSTCFVAANWAQIASLKFIYENCGDLFSWSASYLEDFEDSIHFPESVKEYLRSIAESWRQGLNCTVDIKPAKQNK